MADYSKSSLFEIREYLWENLKADGILDKDDYIADGFIKPLNPIIPAQQVPEFNNLLSGKTYIVYDFEVNEYDADFWICHENIIFSIVSNEYAENVKIINYLIDLFRRMDETAKEMNGSPLTSGLFKYYFFYINSVSSPTPFDEEGGNQIGQVDISYKYSRQIGSDGRFL